MEPKNLAVHSRIILKTPFSGRRWCFGWAARKMGWTVGPNKSAMGPAVLALQNHRMSMDWHWTVVFLAKLARWVSFPIIPSHVESWESSWESMHITNWFMSNISGHRYHLVNENNYGQSPFLVGKPIINCHFPQRTVSLPAGSWKSEWFLIQNPLDIHLLSLSMKHHVLCQP